VSTFTDSVESVAGRHDPGIGGGPLQILAEVFEHRWMFRGQRSEIIYRFVNAGGEAGRGDVVPQNAAIHHLREEARPRNKFAHQVRDVLLTFRRESLLITSAPAKCNNDYLLRAGQS